VFTVVALIAMNKLQMPVTPRRIKCIDSQSHCLGLFWSMLEEKRNFWRSL